MIPYFELTTIPLGPINLHVWGFFVASGFVLASLAAGWMAKRRGDDPKIIYDLTAWLMITGFLGGRLGHVLFYDFAYYLAHPIEALRVWEGGLSIFGGIFASAAFAIFYLRRKRVDVWRYADTLAFGIPVGLFVGRIGCFLIHDHPGTATDFALGVQYPDGVTRHDHGLYLSLNGLMMALFFFWLARKPRPTGVYLSILMVWYGCVRFFLDFYRINDVTYRGLTPAQYFSILVFLVGIIFIVRNIISSYGREKAAGVL